MSTLIHALHEIARRVPDRGISIFDRRGSKAERRTYAQLRDAALDRAARLAACDIKPGERLLICLPTSWELLELYLGAICRGALPVLVAPPGALGGAAAHAQKIAALVELLTPKALVCDESTKRELAEFGQAATADRARTCAELFSVAPAMNTHAPASGDLAFLQLTSGSTGRQRAVMITHSSLLHNTRAIGTLTTCKPDDEAQVVSWLPLNHDMGLVGCFMFALTHGLELTLLRPETFLARPTAWLKQFRSDTACKSPAPNFAYQLCIDRVENADLAALNLSRWEVALTGAEMIRPETCADFASKFSACGFDPKNFVPSYGMAEATLAVSGDISRRGVRTRRVNGEGEYREVVSTGKPLLDIEVKISSPSAPEPFSPLARSVKSG